MKNHTEARIAVIGLGYVGLPLAVAFGAHRPAVGFHVNVDCVVVLRAGHDDTLEVTDAERPAADQLRATENAAALAYRSVFVVTEPAAIHAYRRPALRPLLTATEVKYHQQLPGSARSA